MPYQLDTHVLTVDANVIHKVDTSHPANLYSMWTVFSRCADSVEQGRRLENLSWRIWQKEKLAESGIQQNTSTAFSSNTQNSQTLPQDIPSDTRISDVPQLSGSVESITDTDEVVEITSVSAPLEIARPRIQRQDSSTSSRSNFEKLIVSIVQDKAPLSAPTQPKITMAPIKDTREPQPSLERSGSTTTESQSPSKASDRSFDSQPSPEIQPRNKTTVVRGFSPSSIPITHVTPPKPTTDASIPEPASSPAAKPVHPKNSKMFSLGCSASSSEQSQTPEPQKKRMFQLGGSSEEEGSLKSALSPSGSGGLSHKKQTSFSNVVTTHHVNTDSAIDSDTEDEEYACESAIDEDDSSDWEDSVEESSKSSVDEKYFRRVDSKTNLPSRRSLITLGLTQSEARLRANHPVSASTSALPRSSQRPEPVAGSPNDSDEQPLMMRAARQNNARPAAEAPRSNPQAIPAPSSAQVHRAQVIAHGALSPRTTRRNMLSTELTESLRRHLLWERQQKSAVINAVMKRRNTTLDMANLKQYPEQSCMKKSEDIDATAWNQYFAKDTGDSYHSKGW